MNPRQALTAGRRAAEALMVDSVVIKTLPVRSEQIDEHGNYPETVATVYSGKCRFTLASQQVRDVDSQGQDLAVADGILAIPVAATGSASVAKDHQARITLAANDAVVIDAKIEAAHAQTFATARRFPVTITN